MNPTEDPQFDRLPEALADRLRDADGPRALVPPDVDDAVLAAARAQFAQRGGAVGEIETTDAADAGDVSGDRGPFRLWGVGPRGWGGAVAAAVAVGVLVFVVVDGFRDNTEQMLTDLRNGASQPLHLGPGSTMELAWDVDKSGQLDVLDVMILARLKERGEAGVTDAILGDLEQRIVSLDRVVSAVPGTMGDGARLALAQHAVGMLAEGGAG